MSNNFQLMSPAVEILKAAIAADAAIGRVTIWPWIVELAYTANGIRASTITVKQAPLSAGPQAEDLIPAGASLERAVVFPATRFECMPPSVRERHRAHYAAFLTWRKGQAGIVDEAAVAEQAARWVEKWETA